MKSTHKKVKLEQAGSILSLPKGGGVKPTALRLLKRYKSKSVLFEEKKERKTEKKKPPLLCTLLSSQGSVAEPSIANLHCLPGVAIDGLSCIQSR